MLIEITMFLLVGAAAGFLAGLLGVGGGLVIVPVLVAIFEAHQFPAQHVLHMALGTSLASILFTSVSSVRAHHAHAAVRWPIVRQMAAGLALGTFAGSALASRVPSNGLKWVFVLFAYVIAAQMLANVRPKPTRQLPGVVGLTSVGGLIGGMSSFVGIGGGSLSVPFLTLCNVSMPQAVGTSAALGFPIAVGGLAGYALNGLAATGLPDGSFGYLYLPALIAIVIASVGVAPVGARLAHRLPVAMLKRCFAALLLVLASKMLWSLI